MTAQQPVSIVDPFLSQHDRFALAREAAAIAFTTAVRKALDDLLAEEVTVASYARYTQAHADATARYRDVYIGGPDLVAPVLRGRIAPVDGAPYRISPLFPPAPCDVFTEVVARIRAGVLTGRQTAAACWCALVSPPEIAALLDEMYGTTAEEPPRLSALRRFVEALPGDCQFSLVAAAF